MRLQGKVALVTGAAQGIGRAIALEMAREGADVAIADLDIDRALRTADDVKHLGVRAVAIQVDVSDSAGVERMFRECWEKLGEVDILVNNAGIGSPTRGLELTEADWDRVLDVNLKAMFLCCRVAAPRMAERGWGKIVNISSRSAFSGNTAFDLAYASSKAGVIGFTRGLARVVAPKGVTVNAIAPGAIDTEMPTRDGRRDPVQYAAHVKSSTPMRRAGAPEEVARVAVFLASDDSSYVTGTTTSVSGGSLMH